MCHGTTELKVLARSCIVCKSCAYNQLFVNNSLNIGHIDASDCTEQLYEWFPKKVNIINEKLFRRWILTTDEQLFHCPTVNCSFSCTVDRGHEIFSFRCPLCNNVSRITSFSNYTNRKKRPIEEVFSPSKRIARCS